MNSINAAAIREQPVDIIDWESGDKLCAVKAGPKTHIQLVIEEIEREVGIPARLLRICDGQHKFKHFDQVGASIFKEALADQTVPKLDLRRLTTEEAACDEARHKAIEKIRGGDMLIHMEEGVLGDPEVVLFAVENHNPAELQHADDNVKSDFDTMIAALKISSTCMYYVAENLWLDRTFMKRAVSIDGLLLGQAMVPTQWRSDVEIVMYACEKHGHALKYASEELKDNRSVVLAAVNQKGTSLMYASEELRSDYAVVLDAVRNNRMAIVHAKGGLREDDDIRAAAGQGPSDKMIEKVDRIKAKFHELDVNGDGFLSYEELESLLRKGNPDLEESEMRLLYDQLDTHHDGRVDFHEFCDYIFGDDH